LTTQGSNTTPGAVVVPVGKSKLKQIIVAIGDNTPTGADKNANYLLRLTGSGLKESEHTFVVGGYNAVFTTAGDTGFGCLPAWVFNVDIDVIGNGTIGIYAQQALGVDVGIPEMGVALGFA
jgi:hypothetical protein